LKRILSARIIGVDLIKINKRDVFVAIEYLKKQIFAKVISSKEYEKVS
jgi:hypothetical protein